MYIPKHLQLHPMSHSIPPVSIGPFTAGVVPVADKRPMLTLIDCNVSISGAAIPLRTMSTAVIVRVLAVSDPIMPP